MAKTAKYGETTMEKTVTDLERILERFSRQAQFTEYANLMDFPLGDYLSDTLRPASGRN
jgi:hypothetical protein